MNSTQAPSATRLPPSAVSGAWRAIKDDIETHGQIRWDVTDNDGRSTAYRLLIAADRETRERAYRLAHRVYARQGYVADDKGLCLARYDADPQTLTLLVEDDRGAEVATISLVFDAASGLPSDEVYHPELSELRCRQHKVVEVTRLAMEGVARAASKLLLLRLFNFIYIFARHVRGFTDFVIEVNPHHVGYYKRLLAFQEIGPERPCPRVAGAPAVLLRLNLVQAECEIEALRRTPVPTAAARVLYGFVYNAEDEAAVAEFLARRHQPMSREEALYFEAALLAPAESVGA